MNTLNTTHKRNQKILIKTQQTPTFLEVVVMLNIGCAFGMLTLAWMGLL